VVKEANKYVGERYSVPKLVAHLLDWLLLGAYLFRRLVSKGKYPICSWLVAHAFAKAGKYFDVPPGMADPDHIWDFVTKEENKDKYKEIHPLQPIWGIDESQQE
jgi:hypothetical protein